MSDREEVLLETAYVLHHRPFRNTSLLLDCLTVTHGRVGLVSQGARRARSGARALLQPFTELRLSWIRRGELGRLIDVEAVRHAAPLAGDALLAGFYLNELIIRLVARGDANAPLFTHYRDSLAALVDGPGVARIVRLFELRLLETLGYRVELDRDWRTGTPIEVGSLYMFEIESGPTIARPGHEAASFPGEHLISLREGRLDDAASLRSARQLLGRILDTYIGGRPLRSRDVMRQVIGRRGARLAETTEQGAE